MIERKKVKPYPNINPEKLHQSRRLGIIGSKSNKWAVHVKKIEEEKERVREFIRRKNAD